MDFIAHAADLIASGRYGPSGYSASGATIKRGEGRAIFQDTRKLLVDWFQVMYCSVSQKNGDTQLSVLKQWRVLFQNAQRSLLRQWFGARGSPPRRPDQAHQKLENRLDEHPQGCPCEVPLA